MFWLRNKKNNFQLRTLIWGPVYLVFTFSSYNEYTSDFQKSGILTCVDSDEPVRPPFKLRNFKYVQAVAQESWNIQATSKGSDQTARMRRLV